MEGVRGGRSRRGFGLTGSKGNDLLAIFSGMGDLPGIGGGADFSGWPGSHSSSFGATRTGADLAAGRGGGATALEGRAGGGAELAVGGGGSMAQLSPPVF